MNPKQHERIVLESALKACREHFPTETWDEIERKADKPEMVRILIRQANALKIPLPQPAPK